MKVLAVQMNPTIGDVEGNARKVLDGLDRAREKQADIVLFPELSLSGYFPDDLLLDPGLIDAVKKQLERIEPATNGLFAVIGLPRWNLSRKQKPLYNSAAVFADGKLLGYKNKTLLPTYDVFDEARYFEPGLEEPIWEYLGHKIAVTICEDVWQYAGLVGYTNYAQDPVMALKKQRPDLVLNLSGSPYSLHHKSVRFEVFGAASRLLQCPTVVCNQVGANDSLVFDGHSFFLNEKGEIMQVAKGFVEEDLLVDLHPHACPCRHFENGIKDLYSALVLGVRDYFRKLGFKKALLGLSGGIDSALVACIAKDALGQENVLAIGLPSRFSAPSSMLDAKALAMRLEIGWQEISMNGIFQHYLDLLEPLFEGKPMDETEENLQSRIRSMILMAFSNKFGALLLNTGNKSEMALGYTTLYGDMAGALGVLHDVTKSYVYKLAEYVNREKEVIPYRIIEKPPSAELRENQTDFESLPPYEILDAVIEDYVEERLSAEEIAAKRGFALEQVSGLVQKIHLAEYKRRQAPIGIRVTQKAFGKGRIVPIVQKWHV